MERVSMQVWMQRYGALALLLVAFVFTILSSLLAERAAGVESGARRGAQVSSMGASDPSLAQPAQH
jgi:hypothetical protein